MAYKWESNIRKVVPYVPGEQPKDKNIIKLNTNENPYPPSKKVSEMVENADFDILKKYPDATAGELVEKLAEFHGLDKSQVFVGVGSDDVLGMSFMTFFNSDKKVIFPDITYSFYPVWCDLLKIPYETIPLKEDFTIDYEEYLGECGGVVIANPNAPTGILLDKEKIIKIIEANPEVIVIVDEAYIDFAPEGSSCLDLIDRYDNLLVVRTYSKSRSLAGIRIGYAMGNPALIKYLNDVKYSYNSYTMNVPSIKIGSAVIDDDEYFKGTISKVVKTREWFTEELGKLGFFVLPSSTNFVFASHKDKAAKDIFQEGKNRGIYIRYFNQPRIDNFLRITIGTDEEMKKLVEFLTDYLK
ncbi:MAG: histidinol-phosphate transaminase [Eubacterium sp.]|nr:histidinol-phosphate transaminase [Eubacterium sp.]